MKRQWMVLVGHVDQREREVIINVSLFEALRRGLVIINLAAIV